MRFRIIILCLVSLGLSYCCPNSNYSTPKGSLKTDEHELIVRFTYGPYYFPFRNGRIFFNDEDMLEVIGPHADTILPNIDYQKYCAIPVAFCADDSEWSFTISAYRAFVNRHSQGTD